MIDEFVRKLKLWSERQTAVKAVAIVGSWARGTARPDSDIDIILITTEPEKLLSDTSWLSEFGRPKNTVSEDWGLVQSLRVLYSDGKEIEFGVTTEQWASAEEISLGTGRVVRDGIKVVFDPKSLLSHLIVSVEQST